MDQTSEHFAVDWLRQHGELLYSYAIARVGGDAAAAEDLVQETLLAGLRANDSFRGDSSRGTWLVGILRKKVVDHYRREGNRQEVSASAIEGEESFQNLLADPGGAWRAAGGGPETQEFAEVFDKCLASINPQLAQAFILVVMDGLSTQETCSLLGITPTNLSVRLCRARLELRKELTSRWFER